MALPVQLLGALGDYVFVGWADGRVTLETPAPVTFGKTAAMSVLLATAGKQTEIERATRAPDGEETS